ncbi:unnamed protein product [Rotaria magnacalcarata]|uniref:Uncharacterized protein n=1 Tax=Rotaria magnacalcarata TaxID=392030 RepID=A0A816V0H9_9BILA|nr:unnamed protein product [Rotaria magnacalcarata]
MWIFTGKSIPPYIATIIPFFYFLGLVPRFWRQAKMTEPNFDSLPSMNDSSDIAIDLFNVVMLKLFYVFDDVFLVYKSCFQIIIRYLMYLWGLNEEFVYE